MNTEIILSPAQSQAWLAMAAKKNEISNTLKNYELELQSILLNKPVESLPEALKLYRAKHSEMKELRLSFTSIIDSKIVQPLMEFEKRADPKINADYLSAEKKEIANRLAATKKLQEEQNKAVEIGNFKAHFQNEYTKIVAEIRLKYATIISEAYQHALIAKTPVDNIEQVVLIAASAIKEVKPKDVLKFSRLLIGDAEAKSIFDCIIKPDYPALLSNAIIELNDKFSLYSNDIAIAELAAAQEAQSFKATVVESEAEVQQEIAANTIIAQAESFVLPEAGFKSIVETTRIKIIDDSPMWVLKVTTAFVQNFQTAFTKLRVKKYSSLSVAQMAAALDSIGAKVEGVEYENILK